MKYCIAIDCTLDGNFAVLLQFNWDFERSLDIDINEHTNFPVKWIQGYNT